MKANNGYGNAPKCNNKLENLKRLNSGKLINYNIPTKLNGKLKSNPELGMMDDNTVAKRHTGQNQSTMSSTNANSKIK